MRASAPTARVFCLRRDSHATAARTTRRPSCSAAGTPRPMRRLRCVACCCAFSAREMCAHAALAQCYRDDEMLAFHMQNDTTEEYVQWLRRGCKELTGPVTPKPVASLPSAADCSTPTSQRKTSRTSTRCACSAHLCPSCASSDVQMPSAATRPTARALRRLLLLLLRPAQHPSAPAFCRASR